MKLLFNLSRASLLIILSFVFWDCSGKKDDPTPVIRSSAKDIKTFVFSTLSPVVWATINSSASTITAIVPVSTNITKLVPFITISDKATISPASDVVQDFSKAVVYTVTAEDGSTQAYTVTVTKTAAVCRIVGIAGTSTDGANKTTYQVDSLNRLMKSNYEEFDRTGTITLANTTIYLYDTGGFLTSQVTTYTYAVPSPTNIQGMSHVYTYRDSRLTKDLIAYKQANGQVNTLLTYQYEYDTQGSLSKRIYTMPDGSDETIIMANGSVTSITGSKTTFIQNAQGFVTKSTASDGSYRLYQYNAAGQQTLQEYYTSKGIKTAYTATQYASITYYTPVNPVAFKGHPTFVPSAYGVQATREKTTAYVIDDNGKEIKSTETTYTYEGNSQGNVTRYIYSNSSLYQSATPTITTTYTYEYQGCP